MKNTKLIYVFLMLIATAMVNTSCNNLEDDDPGLIVTVADFSLTLEEGTIADGEVIGQVRGTSNQGSVNFEITSQTPTGALTIDPTIGELTVADVSHFISDEQISAVVTITKDDIVKTSNLKIAVVPPVTITCDTPLGTPIDLSAFRGDLVISEVTADGSLLSEIQGQGDASDACGIVEITGDFTSYCDLVNVTILNLVPTDATTGTFVIEENTPYVCDPPEPGTGYVIQGTGTYDLTTSTINLYYTWSQAFYDTATGELVSTSENGSANLIITPGTADPNAGGGSGGGDDGDSDYEIVITDPVACAGTVDTSMWEGELNLVEDYGDGDLSDPIALVGTPGDTCSLTLVGDLVNYGCPETSYDIFFIPEGEGATTGTIVSDEQLFDCQEDGFVNSVKITGTYDLSISEIRLTYDYLEDGESVFPGNLIITLKP